MNDLVVINADVGLPNLVLIRLSDGRIVDVNPHITVSSSDDVLDVGGAAVVPGLHDHHIHLCALAASRSSLQVGPPHVLDRERFVSTLAQATRELPNGSWIRAVGYHESVAGHLDRHVLDALIGDRPIRVQHRTGIFWTLNTAGLARLPAEILAAPGTERDADNLPTGRLIRMDAIVRDAFGLEELDLAAVSAQASRFGITGFTDATPLETASELDAVADAVATGAITQSITVMTAPGCTVEVPPGIILGPVKILLDDFRLPSFEAFRSMVIDAHETGRPVAVHCVTRLQTVLTAAVLAEAGALAGDRIEHGSLIPRDLLPDLARSGVTVITNPGFITERGDSYLEEVEAHDLPDLYRSASLREAGLHLAAGTDAPFGPPDPWHVVRAASTRTTRSGQLLGAGERLSEQDALSLFLGSAQTPEIPRRIRKGETADLCVLRLPLHEALRVPSAENVGVCLAGGEIVADNR
jgi:predicted amidohydrolase YtcJ